MVVTEITGTLSWPTAMFRPASPSPSAVSGVFTVLANKRTTTPGGPFGGEVEHLTPVTPGEIVSVAIAEDTCRATYRIAEPPMGQQLMVTVDQRGLRSGPLEVEMGPVTTDGDLVMLTVAEPTRTGVDFIAIVIHVA